VIRGPENDMDTLMRRPDVERVIGLSRSTIYVAMDRGEFPRPIKIGKRAVAWRESDIKAWLASRSTGTAAIL
jgi:prophage regulatory protein